MNPLVTLSDPALGVQADWDVPIWLRDGVTLRANVFRPDGQGPFPVIVSAHPYGKDKIPAKSKSGRALNFQYRLFPQPTAISMSRWTSWEAPDPAFWVARGYVVVNVDLRGGGHSEGTSDVFSDEEAADYAEIIQWAGTQSWSNTKVGLLGVSYLTLSQYKVAALRPPHLAAVCPWEGFSDLYRDFTYPGGIRETGFSIIWPAALRKTARVAGDLRRELANRPERDDWYAQRTPVVEDIEVPLLVCGSFSDHLLHTRGSFEVFRRARSRDKWLYTHRDGKWSHFYSEDARHTQAAFFDHFLKGADNGWRQRPPVRLAVYERGARPVLVSQERQWPPDDLMWQTLHLDGAARSLTPTEPHQETSGTFATRGPGLQFTWTAPYDLDLIGPSALRLFLQVEGCDDLNLFACLRKFSHGREVTFEGSYGFSGAPMTVGWQRAAFRDLDPDLSAPHQPVHTYRRLRPLGQGEIVEVHVSLLPHATRLRADDQLSLDLCGSWPYPRNPLTGQFPSGYRASHRGHATLHTGPTHPSGLLIGSRPIADALSRTTKPADR